MIETFMNLDGTILLWIQENLIADWLNPIFTVITHLGDVGAVWVVASVALITQKKTRKVGIYSLYALGIAFIFDCVILKPMVARARPFDVLNSVIPLIGRPTDFSFPSGHTAGSFAVAWTMFRLLPKKYGMPALVMALLIGFSRLYVGVHYPTDVLFGAVSGILVSYLSTFILGTLFFNWNEERV